MIKHSSSLLISLFIHTLLISSILYLYTSFSKEPIEPPKEKKVALQLSHFVEKKALPTPVQKKRKPKEKKELIQHTKIIKKVIQKKKKEKRKVTIKEKKQKIKQLVKIEKNEKLKERVPVVKENISTPKKVESKVVKPNYLDDNMAKIRELIQTNLYYPRRARKRAIQGEVIVAFTLSKKAEVTSITIVKSKHKILSKSAIRTIEDLSSKFPKPSENIIVKIPISYRLK